MEEFIMLNVLISSGISDLRDYKISNPIIITGWCAALICRFYRGGVDAAVHGILFIIIPIAAAMPLFLIRAVGAGDIKLLSVISSFYGIHFLLKVTCLTLTLAAVLSFLKLVRKRAFLERFHYFFSYVLYGYQAGDKYYIRKRDGVEFVIPLAPVMAAAYFMTLIFNQYGVWKE